MAKSSDPHMNTSDERSVSVVMPVHNAIPYLDKAVESVLAQSLRNFEFIIYDDASTDGSAERAQHWARSDSRIKFFQGTEKLGPAASSNRVVRFATSPLVARMDADDISLPDRLQQQSSALARKPNAGIVASLCEVIDSRGRQIRGPEFWRLARKSWSPPFPHGSMMFRRDLFEKVGGYREECEFWEDLDFVIRASKEAQILVLSTPLYQYRQSVSSTRMASDQARVENALDLRYRSIAALRGNETYDDVLSNRRPGNDQRVDPRVFLSLGLLALWSDRRPATFRRFFRRSRLRPDVATIATILWLSFATVAPRAVRKFMNGLSRLRNAAARPRLAAQRIIEWQPVQVVNSPAATKASNLAAGDEASDVQ
jgi:glycosyltransferase involved in cell wall biosynthesis